MCVKAFIQNHPKQATFLACILTITTVALGLMLNPFLTVVNLDAAIFCLLGKSLATGQGYLLLSEPHPQPYFTFPPLLPFLIAALIKLTGNMDLAQMQWVFKGLIDVLFLGSIAVFYGWLRQCFDTKTALILTPIYALNAVVFKYLDNVLSDIPYLVFSMTALYTVACWYQSRLEGAIKKQWVYFITSLILILMAGLTRQIGLALMLSFWCFLVEKRAWKQLMSALVFLGIGVGSWQVYEHIYRSSHPMEADALNQAGVNKILDKSPIKLEYVKHFLVVNPVSEDQSRVHQNLSELGPMALLRMEQYSQLSIDQILPTLKIKLGKSKYSLFHLFPFLILFWLVLALGFKECVSKIPMLTSYTVLYMGVLLVYPYVSIRFLLPLIGFLFLFLFRGVVILKQRLEGMSHPLPQKGAAVLIPAFIVLTLSVQLSDTLHFIKEGHKLQKANQGPSLKVGNRGYYQAVLWIKKNTPEDSFVMSRKPPVTYFYGNRKSLCFAFTHNAKALFEGMTEKQKRYSTEFPHFYILEDTAFNESVKYLTPALKQYQSRLTLAYTEPKSGTRVWLLNPPTKL